MEHYLPPSFQFQLFLGSSSLPDATFQEVSGLSAEMAVDEVGEGGENRFKHRLPTPPKYGNLVLKRGVIKKTSGLSSWCSSTLSSSLSAPLTPHDIVLVLLSAEGKALMTWNYVGAYPVKWNVADFNSPGDELIVESLEFAYNHFSQRGQ